MDRQLETKLTLVKLVTNPLGTYLCLQTGYVAECAQFPAPKR